MSVATSNLHINVSWDLQIARMWICLHASHMLASTCGLGIRELTVHEYAAYHFLLTPSVYKVFIIFLVGSVAYNSSILATIPI